VEPGAIVTRLVFSVYLVRPPNNGEAAGIIQVGRASIRNLYDVGPQKVTNSAFTLWSPSLSGDCSPISENDCPSGCSVEQSRRSGNAHICSSLIFILNDASFLARILLVETASNARTH